MKDEGRRVKGARIIIVLLAGMMVGCGGSTGPQRPSQIKGERGKMKDERKEASGETLALMELNQQLRISADESLRSIVQQEEQPYALYEGGVWATIIERGDIERGAPKLGEECAVHMRVRSLEGMLYSDEETTATVGKYVWPTAVDRNITEWNHGAKIQLYAPWYVAYGVAGKDPIPPYENVIIELEIE